ncbi:MAG: dihydropteroate synthase [bacterium]|nr:dihydropteroate synthase [bacterium]
MSKPKVMGILNVTPDSFSDGGRYYSLELACKHAEKMLKEGADWIDIGGESTRPGAEEISLQEEQRRILPVIQELIHRFPSIQISVDTKNSDTAKKAIQLGAKMVNDVTAGRYDETMFQVIAESNVYYVMMHSRGDSKTMMNFTHYNNLIHDIYTELMSRVKKAISAGVHQNQIIVDPGIGFAKTSQQNLIILKNLNELKKWNYPILIGASRKSFIGAIDQSSPQDRLGGSIAVASICAYFRVDYIRVHDVKETVQAIQVVHSIFSS